MVNKIHMLTEPYRFEVSDTELPEPSIGYVTINYLFCGICEGDYSRYIGRRKDYPISLGHEFVAKVVNPGTSDKMKKGNIVISDLNYRCGSCSSCKRGASHLCINNNLGLFSNRGFAQYANINEDYLFRIEPLRYLPSATFIEPLSCVIHACEGLEINESSSILIVGAGSIGTMFAFCLKYRYNCSKVEITDIIPEREIKVNNCFGTRIYNGYSHEYDIIIECSNSSDGLKFVLNNIGNGGCICVMRHLYGLDTSFVYEALCQKEIHATFPLRNGNTSNMIAAIELISRHWAPKFDSLIRVYTDINRAFSEKKKTVYNKQVVQFF